MGLLLILGLAIVLLVPLSYVIESLRKAPGPPGTLRWAPEIPIHYVDVGGVNLRYVVAGEGRPIVLIHTLRTQLDLFEKVVPALARDFRVYAVDYPGHGFSDIPDADYTPELFAASVRGFLDAVDVNDAILVGESIGGTLALLLAAEQHPRVKAVVAINSYDYDRGRGIHRGSPISRLVFTISNVPILGGTVWRFRWAGAFRLLIRGSVHDPASLPPDLVREMHEVGNRRNHYRAFMSLVRNFPKWEDLRSHYPRIDRPALLVYGEHDWSRPAERESNRASIPGVRFEEVAGAGHLFSLDAPEDAIRLVRDFATAVDSAD